MYNTKDVSSGAGSDYTIGAPEVIQAFSWSMFCFFYVA